MFSINSSKRVKKILTTSVASLFITLQLPLLLFASPIAYADEPNTVQQTQCQSDEDCVPTPVLGNIPCPENSAEGSVDGTDKENLQVSFPAYGTATVATTYHAPICRNTTVFFSSYVIPANYDGQGFELASGVTNPTVYPQPIFDSTLVTLPAGFKDTITLNIKMPATCNNVQVDVYYPPEITTVTIAGHGAQYISGLIYNASGHCPVVTPPNVSIDAAVTLCEASDSESISYTKQTVSAASAANDHYYTAGGESTTGHQHDIIPAFIFNGKPFEAQNFSVENQTIYNNACQAPVATPTDNGGDHVGLGGGSGETPTTTSSVLTILTPPVVVTPPTVTIPVTVQKQLVNTGSTMLLNIFAGLFIIGTAGTLAAVPNKRRYS